MEGWFLGIPIPVLLFGGVVVLILVAGVWNWLREKKRREAFQKMAAELGLQYCAKDSSFDDRFFFLDKLDQGSNRYAFNILEGVYQEYPVYCFDYHYETYSTDSKGRRQTHHHYFSFFVLMHAHQFPELKIYKEGLFSKIGQAIGFDDIDFESNEFSSAFVVRCPDKKFAYDVCHTRMMEYLLKNRDLSIEIEGPCLALEFDRRLSPDAIPTRLHQLIEIRNLFPKYLFRD